MVLIGAMSVNQLEHKTLFKFSPFSSSDFLKLLPSSLLDEGEEWE